MSKSDGLPHATPIDANRTSAVAQKALEREYHAKSEQSGWVC